MPASAILLPFEKLALEENKSKEQILEEKLEKLLKGGEEHDGEDDVVVTGVVPLNLLPPPFVKEKEIQNSFEREGGEGGEGGGEENKDVEESTATSKKTKSSRNVRSMYHGFAPGFKSNSKSMVPWTQTVFSMELPRVKGVRGNGAFQF